MNGKCQKKNKHCVLQGKRECNTVKSDAEFCHGDRGQSKYSVYDGVNIIAGTKKLSISLHKLPGKLFLLSIVDFSIESLPLQKNCDLSPQSPILAYSSRIVDWQGFFSGKITSNSFLSHFLLFTPPTSSVLDPVIHTAHTLVKSRLREKASVQECIPKDNE